MLGRARQFLTAGLKPAPADLELAARHLSPALLALFLRQHPRDVVHGAATARWLLDRGHDDKDLIAAALLHDVGKGDQRRIDRVAYVAAGWIGLSRRLGRPDSRLALRRAVARSLAHSETGAAALATAGAGERIVNLARHHHASAGDDAMLALLQQADAAN